MQSSVFKLTFNEFFENTYIVACRESKLCIIIDPGCNNADEFIELETLINKEGLEPILLINTHCHLDHIFGNAWAVDKYDIPLHFHEDELPVQQSFQIVASHYGFKVDPTPPADEFLAIEKPIRFGEVQFDLLFTPGHSPGSVSLWNKADGYVISGDVLFKNSIGRTDLPGGDFDLLMRSLNKTMMSLPDQTIVYSGHGPDTSIGEEKRFNPFLQNLK